jgi:glycosyltransferase involved in cell wall biosynthesis
VRDERPRLYRTADIQFFGVERAAFALTLLEGMATALPIITTDFEGHEFTGRAGEHFVTSPFGNVPRLVERLLELAQDPYKRKELGMAARERVKLFTWTKITDEILRVYDETLSLCGGASANDKVASNQ